MFVGSDEVFVLARIERSETLFGLPIEFEGTFKEIVDHLTTFDPTGSVSEGFWREYILPSIQTFLSSKGLEGKYPCQNIRNGSRCDPDMFRIIYPKDAYLEFLNKVSNDD